jgi:hypothetical protein
MQRETTTRRIAREESPHAFARKVIHLYRFVMGRH